jgi:hypothetical protein
MPTVENFWYFLGLTIVIRGELADCADYEDERVEDDPLMLADY